MRLILTRQFEEDYASAPIEVQKAFDKQGRLLLQNLRHTSLRAKKFDESRGLWQARVNRAWRFYFTIEGDAYLLHTIIAHPK